MSIRGLRKIGIAFKLMMEKRLTVRITMITITVHLCQRNATVCQTFAGNQLIRQDDSVYTSNPWDF